MAIDPINVDGKKYTFQTADNGYSVDVLRHGKPWVVIDDGCNAVHALMYEVARLRGDEPRSTSEIVESIPADARLAVRDALTTAIDAPRLAARTSATIVARDDEEGYRLLSTTAGEWGVFSNDNEEDRDDGEDAWFTGPDAERAARRLYAEERGKLLCECDAEVDEDDAVSDGDGLTMCQTCATAAREVWASTNVKCNGDADLEPCPWKGKGAEAAAGGHCPSCGGTVEEVTDDATPHPVVVVPGDQVGDRPRAWYSSQHAAEKFAALFPRLHRLSAAEVDQAGAAWAVVFADPAMDATVPPRDLDGGEVKP